MTKIETRLQIRTEQTDGPGGGGKVTKRNVAADAKRLAEHAYVTGMTYQSQKFVVVDGQEFSQDWKSDKQTYWFGRAATAADIAKLPDNQRESLQYNASNNPKSALVIRDSGRFLEAKVGDVILDLATLAQHVIDSPASELFKI